MLSTRLLSLLFLSVLLGGCGSGEEANQTPDAGAPPLPTLEGVPLPQRAPEHAKGIPFLVLRPASATGIRIPGNGNGPEESRPETKEDFHLSPLPTSGALAAADLDGDGDVDLLLSRPESGLHVFRCINAPSLQYEEVTEAVLGEHDTNSAAGISILDVNRDGLLDIYLCRRATEKANLLLLNPGSLDRVFQEGAAAYGLALTGGSIGAHFGDADGDLDLDLLLLDVEKPGRFFVNHSEPETGTVNFVDETTKRGLRTLPRKSRSAAWIDANADGLPDLYVAEPGGQGDALFVNRPKSPGTFERATEQLLPSTPRASAGLATGDFNRDGAIDLFVLDHLGDLGPAPGENQQWPQSGEGDGMRDASALFLSSGMAGSRFLEAARLSGIRLPPHKLAAASGDLNNDGRQDLWITGDRSFGMLNRDTWKFEEHTATESPVHHGVSALLVDLDRDGDLDVVTAKRDAEISIHENVSTRGHRVQVAVRGPPENPQALGARVVLTEKGGEIQARTISPSNGMLEFADTLIHFGLSRAEEIQSLSVELPGHLPVAYGRLKPDHRYEVDLSTPAKRDPAEPGAADEETDTIFASARNTLSRVGQDWTPYNDFEVQEMLPWKLSDPGPGISLGDLDGDGDDDFIRGQANDEGIQFVYNNLGPDPRKPDRIRFRREPFWFQHPPTGREGTSLLLFEANGDGNLDLYVANGSNEVPINSHKYDDMLMLGAGGGKLIPADPPARPPRPGDVLVSPELQGRLWRLPLLWFELGELEKSRAVPHFHDSGSTATAADFDRDGDLDLFVGSRLVPHGYPAPPRSRFLRNDSDRDTGTAKFVDVTPFALELGMVTSAVWSDVDDDGWIDLVVVSEWGPPQIVRNRDGQGFEQVELENEASLLGIWNGIASGDVDGDGDIDFALTNAGLNTELQLDETGAVVYSLGTQESEETLRATELRSGILINESTGPGQVKMTFKPLPDPAQIAPSFGVVLEDFSGDGKLDAALAQNHASRRPQKGPANGGLSLYLVGNGDGSFQAISPDLSGIAIGGDARALVTGDLDRDTRPDLVFSVQKEDPRVFFNRSGSPKRFLAIRLEGKPRNPRAVGARVTLELKSGRKLLRERRAGGGHLSQSTATLFFGIPENDPPTALAVRWPDSTTSSHSINSGKMGRTVTIRKPETDTP